MRIAIEDIMKKENKLVSYFRDNKKTAIITAAIILLINFLFVYLYDYIAYRDNVKVLDWMIHETKFVMLSWLIWILFFGFFYCIWQDLRIPGILLSVICVLIGSANFLKYQYRHEFVLPTDLTIVNEWKTAFKSISIYVPMKAGIAAGILLTVNILIWLFERRKKKKIPKFTLKTRLFTFAGYCVCVVLGYVFLFTPFVEKTYWANFGDSSYLAEEETGLYRHGVFLVGLEQFAIKDYPIDDKEIEKAYTELLVNVEQPTNDVTVKPNIIVIMSEALWDVDNLSNVISYNKDPMEAFHKLQNQYGGGSIAVNIFGGGTANTEFEMLTGYNVKNLKGGTIAYTEYFEREQPSLVSYVEDLGYRTIAVHPYEEDFYDRDVAYEKLGFDEFVGMDDMKYTDKYDAYISDDSLTKEIISRYEEYDKEGDEPFFCFSVSMANHGTNMLNNSELEDIQENNYFEKVIDVDYKSYEESFEMDRYVNGIYYTGQALQEMVDYFDKIDEPTIIMVFGDHALANTEQYQLPCLTLGSKSIEKTEQSKYFTPLILYNNYGLDKMEVDGVNASYLSNVLLDYAKFPLPKQGLINAKLMEHLKTNTVYCLRDSSGKYLGEMTPEQNALDYDSLMVEYDMLNGNQLCNDLWDLPQ